MQYPERSIPACGQVRPSPVRRRRRASVSSSLPPSAASKVRQ
jgi:hypothetical protein